MNTVAEQASKEQSETALRQSSSKGQGRTGSKTEARPSIAMALFKETDAPNMTPCDHHSADEQVNSETPANHQHNADLQEKADVTDE